MESVENVAPSWQLYRSYATLKEGGTRDCSIKYAFAEKRI